MVDGRVDGHGDDAHVCAGVPLGDGREVERWAHAVGSEPRRTAPFDESSSVGWGTAAHERTWRFREQRDMQGRQRRKRGRGQ